MIKKMYFHNKLTQLCMGQNLDMESYLKEIIIRLGQLVAIGATVNNDDIIQIVFNVLFNNYDAFIQFVSTI